MSKLKELIQKLCPNGVEYRKLGEVCDFINGFAFKSSLFKDIGEPIIRITNINGNAVDLSNVKYFNASDYKSDLQPFAIYYGDILIAMSGATTGKIGYYCNKSTAYLNQRVGKFVPNKYILKNRYLFHFLCSKINELYIMAGGGAQPNLSSTKLMNDIVIPLPPLEVQKEIVRILDKFTTLEAELEAELTARKKQYEYYRDKLFSFNVLNYEAVGNSLNNIIVMPLGEIGELVRGNGLQKKDLINNGVPAIHYGQIYTYYGVYTDKTISFVSSQTAMKLRKVIYGDVIITNTSENIEDVGKAVTYLVKEQGVTGGHATIFKPSEKILGKYLTYYTQTDNFARQKRIYAKGTKVIDLSTSDLAKIKIPVPSIEEQRRIVSILDKFDMLTTSISEGLPKEIELRRKQYEYYRNQLLSFPDNKATA
ncbi:MAG: restriction endonuclease subunit S [Akkermansia muciniphila]|uniref:restriction endonuclease subunit S n=1 Tax=uncultured Akkermansia sp. TaxID=512294 RepID=UPI00261C73D6|nr:restriction endonuclease subunit S [uncultured Akkermansia sp.]